MKIKRLLLCLVMFIMCVSLVACGSMDMLPIDDLFGSLPIEVSPEEEDFAQPEDFVEKIPDTEPVIDGNTEPDGETPGVTDGETQGITEGETDPPIPVYEDSSVKPLLYKVSDENGNVVWLFGSVHAGREDFYPLPSYVLEAFDNSESFAVELDILEFEKDSKRQSIAYSKLLYKDGTTISDHIPSELYTRSLEILSENDSYVSTLEYYYPALWSSMIESIVIEKTGANIALGIDRHLLERAKSAEKEILEIESASYQYGLLADFSEELQVLLLESAVNTYDNSDAYGEDLSKLMDLWAAGDEYEFAAYIGESNEVMSYEAEMQEYNNAMVVERNLHMADFAENALLMGDEIFICVGSAHVVGDGAVAQLLSDRGYSVECITE